MFPSLIGRLKTTIYLVGDDGGAMFPSLIGRLKTQVSSGSQSVFGRFPSLIGRLKTRRGSVYPWQSRTDVSIPHR